MVVVSRSAQVVIAHAIVALMIQTAVGQHREGKIVGVGRILIEILIGFADDAIGHSPIGHCLVGIVFYMVFLCGSHVLKGTQSREFQSLNGFILQF